ncbi:MAG: hypothetical protein GX683_05980 [Ruminococcaceae bacterium]|nr:hypothetical protein [Oscillospiraceae bacterium]
MLLRLCENAPESSANHAKVSEGCLALCRCIYSRFLRAAPAQSIKRLKERINRGM